MLVQVFCWQYPFHYSGWRECSKSNGTAKVKCLTTWKEWMWKTACKQLEFNVTRISINITTREKNEMKNISMATLFTAFVVITQQHGMATF